MSVFRPSEEQPAAEWRQGLCDQQWRLRSPVTIFFDDHKYYNTNDNGEEDETNSDDDNKVSEDVSKTKVD